MLNLNLNDILGLTTLASLRFNMGSQRRAWLICYNIFIQSKCSVANDHIVIEIALFTNKAYIDAYTNIRVSQESIYRL